MPQHSSEIMTDCCPNCTEEMGSEKRNNQLERAEATEQGQDLHPPLAGPQRGSYSLSVALLAVRFFSPPVFSSAETLSAKCVIGSIPVVSPASSTGHLSGAQYLGGEWRLGLQILVFAGYQSARERKSSRHRSPSFGSPVPASRRALTSPVHKPAGWRCLCPLPSTHKEGSASHGGPSNCSLLRGVRGSPEISKE